MQISNDDLYTLQCLPAYLAEVYDIINAMPTEERQSSPQVKAIAEYCADLLNLIKTL